MPLSAVVVLGLVIASGLLVAFIAYLREPKPTSLRRIICILSDADAAAWHDLTPRGEGRRRAIAQRVAPQAPYGVVELRDRAGNVIADVSGTPWIDPLIDPTVNYKGRSS